jgi:hypothetical protein
MGKIIKNICIGHKSPDFNPAIPFLMVSPLSLGMPNEMIFGDDRFGYGVDGRSLAEYSQLFGLLDLINSGEIIANNLFLFQYRKFLSPVNVGYDSVAPWVKVVGPNLASNIFPDLNNSEFSGRELITGSIYNFEESISSNYSRVHVAEDLVNFSAACACSGKIQASDIRTLASMTGIIPSPAVCYISVELFVEIMEILREVCFVYMSEFYTRREGYQMRSTGYLLERLHSVLICSKIMAGRLNEVAIWNRYVVNTEI